MLRMKRPSSSHIPPNYLFDRPVAFGSGLRGSSTLAWWALLFANRREGVGFLPQERVLASRPPDGPRVVTGHRLRNANKLVKAAIDVRVEQAWAKARMSADEVLERMTVLARTNIGDYMSGTGDSVTIKPSCDLTEAKLYGIRRVVFHQEKRDKNGRVIRAASIKEMMIPLHFI